MICGLLGAGTTAAYADVTVQGTIIDANTKAGLAGVYVQPFMDSKKSAMTDADGHYEITVPDGCKSLRVRRDGYNVQQLPIRGREKGVDAALYPNTFTNNVGLQTDALQSIVAPISSQTTDVSVDNQLGSVLGGQIRSVNRGGVPGMGSFMLLEGVNSLNANAQPLVVLDGIILDMQYSRTALHDGAYNNLLANISVEDIEEVKVLRNGTAIYGAKGSNGVIIINTRRNRSLNTKIDFSAATSMAMLPKLPDLMNASEYRTYASEMLQSAGMRYTDLAFLREDPKYYYYPTYHNETDWTKQAYDEAFTQAYSLNVQGGDDVANYNISVGYSGGDATLKKNDFSRFNMRINSDVKLTDRIKVRLDASYSDTNRDLRDDGVPADVDDNTIAAPGFLSLIKSPFLNPYAYDKKGNLSSFLADADDYLNMVISKKKGSLANPASILHYGEAANKNKFSNRMVTLGIAPEFRLKHGLTITDAFNFTMFNTDENYYLPVTGVPSFEVKGVGDVDNLVASSAAHQYLTNNDLRINWKLNKGGNVLDLTAGWRFALSHYQLNSMKGYNSGNDKMPNMSKELSYKQTSGSNEKCTTLTYYVDGAYNWGGKYFLNASASVEASSRFGKNVGAFQLGGVAWGVFPSASASWVISNEDWFNMGDGINYLRLNAAYDMSGNDDLDLNVSKTYFKAVKLFDNIVGSVVGNIGNTDLRWETTHRINYGADMNLCNNRIALSVNAFKSWTNDLLLMRNLSYVTGIDRNWVNGGKMENNGISVDVRGKLINTRDWQWELGLSVGHYDNKLTELEGDRIFTEAYGATILSEVGKPAGLFYGYKTNGVFSTTQEAEKTAYYITDRTGAKTYFDAGDVRFVDQDANHEINENDRVIIGNPNPDIYGNITNHLQWKRFALDVEMSYSLGNDIYNYQRSILESGSRFHNQTTALRGRWSSEGQQTKVPRITYNDPMGNSRFSDRWIEDGSYLRLKNVSVSYKWDFDYRFLQGITVWGSAANLVTLTRYLGSDPEVSANNAVLFQGIDRGLLPASRSFSLGVKINL